MSASFSTRNLSGNARQQITVTTNDPKRRQVRLTCNAQVLVPFKSSRRFVNFLKVEDSTTPLPQTLSIKRGDGSPLQLELAPGQNAGIIADIQEIEPGEHYELTIGLSPPQKPGKLRSWVKLKTGVKEVPETTVPVYAEIPRSWSEAELLAANR